MNKFLPEFNGRLYINLFEVQYPLTSWKFELDQNTTGGKLFINDLIHKEERRKKMDEQDVREGEVDNSKFKRAVKSSLPYILVGSASLLVSAVLYNKYNAARVAAYTNYLETKADLFAEALDKTTEAIITSLTPKK